MTAYIRNAISKADDAARACGGRNIVGSTFSEVKPTQEIVNWEKVEDYVRRLNAGEQLPSIDVYKVAGKDGWFIEEGHHRFIASQIANKPVSINYKSNSGAVGMNDWQGVTWKEYIDEDQFWD